MAYSANAVSDYISWGNQSALLTGRSTLSFMIRVRFDSLNDAFSTGRWIASSYGLEASDHRQFRLTSFADGHLTLTFYTEGGGAVSTSTSASAVTTGVDYCIVCTYNKTGPSAKIYINGTLSSGSVTGTGNLNIENNSTVDLRVGLGNPSEYYYAAIGGYSDFAIWQSELTSTDATNLTTNAAATIATNLVFNAPMVSDLTDDVASVAGTATSMGTTTYPEVPSGGGGGSSPGDGAAIIMVL